MASGGAPRAHAAQAWSRNIFKFIQQDAVLRLLVAGDVGLGLPVVVVGTVLKKAEPRQASRPRPSGLLASVGPHFCRLSMGSGSSLSTQAR